MVSGRVVETELQLQVGFMEGTLQLRSEGRIESLTPRQVVRFQYYDSTFNSIREFVSVPTKFRDRPGAKNVFLELVYQGEKYSLMRRYIPVAKVVSLVVPLPNWYIGMAVWHVGILEQTTFIYETNKFAYQVTKRVEFWDHKVEGKIDPESIRYKYDNYVLKEIFKDELSAMTKFCSSNRLDFNTQKGMVEALKFVQGVEFVYDRKETPRKLRN